MSTSKALREAAGVLLAEADRIDGKISSTQVMTTFAGRSVTAQEAYALLIAEWGERAKPHPWVDWVSGVPPWEVGDGDVPDDDFLREFGPFLDAATREKIEDSTGAVFFYPNIKKRGGLGKAGWDLVKAETRRLLESQWGRDWCAHEDNIRAGLVPDQMP